MKYRLQATVSARVDILNRITTLFIQKGLPVESVNYRVIDDRLAKVELICSDADDIRMDRIINQADNMVDIAEVHYDKLDK